jgi:hypothetical protein
MSILSAYQIVSAWVDNGGPKNRALAWAAVSLSESSWDTEAISPTEARGLYQIEPYSWPDGAGPFTDWIQPDANTKAAIILSGGGVNFAPWDTAYANIEASGRYSFLAWPENGSAAANNMPVVQGDLGTTGYGTTSAPDVPGLTGSLPDAIRWYGEVANTVLPVLASRARGIGSAARRAY